MLAQASATLHASSSQNASGLDAKKIRTEPMSTDARRIPYDAASAHPSVALPRKNTRSRHRSREQNTAVVIQAPRIETEKNRPSRIS